MTLKRIEFHHRIGILGPTLGTLAPQSSGLLCCEGTSPCWSTELAALGVESVELHVNGSCIVSHQ